MQDTEMRVGKMVERKGGQLVHRLFMWGKLKV
jgi:hypothetical protein